MTTPLLDASATATNGVASDARSLDRLRALASQDPAKAVKQVATQFEALFLQMVLKSMRAATPKSGLFDSSEEQTYTSMLDGQLAQKMAAGNTGLSDVIARQLSRNLPTSPGAGAAGDAAVPTPPAAVVAHAPAGAPTAAVAAAGPVPGQLLQTIRAAQSVRGTK